MKKFFSVLLSIIFALCLLCTLLLSVVRFNFSYSTITKLAGELMKPVSKAAVPVPEDDGLFHPGDKIITLAYYDEDENGFGDFDINSLDLSSIDLSNMDVNAIVQSYLDANDIDVEPELIADILASPDVSQVVDKYADQIINYMTGASEELNIDPVDITNVVNKAIDKYEAATGEVIDRTGLDEAISTNVEAMVPGLTATLDSAKEENAETFDMLKKVNLLLSLKIWILCLVVCAVLALIIVLLNMNVFVWFKYISIPAIVDGLLIFITVLVAKGIAPGILMAALKDAGMPDSVYTVIWRYALSLLKKFEICSIVTTLIGVVLVCLGVTLGKKTKPAKEETTNEIKAE